MAISRVATSGPFTSTNANLTVTEPTGTANGDIMFCWIAHRSAIGFAAPTGWTKLLDASSGNTATNSTAITSGELFYCERGSSAPTLVFTKEAGTGSVNQAHVVTYRGYLKRIAVRSSSITTLASAGTALSTTLATGAKTGDVTLIFTSIAGSAAASSEAYSGSATEVIDANFNTTPFVASSISERTATGSVANNTAATATSSVSNRGTIAAVTLIIDKVKADSFTDNFNDNSLDSAWTSELENGNVTGAETNQRYEIDLTSGTAGFANIHRNDGVFLDCSVFVRLHPMQHSSTGVSSENSLMIYSPDFAYRVKWLVAYGGIVAQKRVAGVDTDVWASYDTAPDLYSEATYGWLRIREAAGTIFWDTAPTSSTNPPSSGDWVNRASIATSTFLLPNLESPAIYLESGASSAFTFDGNPAWFDGYNTAENQTTARIGTLTKTLANTTSSSAATHPVTATTAKTLAGITRSAAATVPVAGTTSKTLANTTLMSTGITVTVRTGTLSKTLANATSASAASHPVTGTTSKTLANATSSSTVTHPITATSSKTLASATSSSAGSHPVTGITAKTLANATTASAGSHPVTGTTSKTLAGIGRTAAATHPVIGTTSKTLASTTLSSSGVQAIVRTGTLNQTLNGIGRSSSGTVQTHGIANKTLQNATTASYVNDPLVANTSKTLRSASVSATAQTRATATLNRSLASSTVVSTALARVTASLAKTLGNTTLAAFDRTPKLPLQNILVIATENRMVSISAEGRTVLLSSENRTAAFGSEERTHYV
jgi:hypothetical protein